MRLTIDLPDPVWHALEAEAKARDQKIGTYAKALFVKRHNKQQERKKP